MSDAARLDLPESGYVLANATVPSAVTSGTINHMGDGLGRADLLIERGEIASVAPCGLLVGRDDLPAIDLDGGLVLPAFVDMHTHLDKGHILPRTRNPDGSFTGALSSAHADRDAYWRAMFEKDLAAYRVALASRRRAFFDRGLPDLVGYAALEGLSPPTSAVEEIERARYADLVFAAPPWRGIYAQDAERKQDWAEAVRTYDAVTTAYVDRGYRLLELQRSSVEDRVRFILDAIA